MGSIRQKLSSRPTVIDTRIDGCDENAVEVLEQSLEFRFYEGRETHNAFPHTTGWRTLPFSVFTCILEHGGTVHMEGSPDSDLRPGDACLIPAGVRHKSDALRPEGVHALWMHFAFRLLGGMSFFALTNPPGPISASQAERGRLALQAIINLHTSPSGNPLTFMAQRRQAIADFLALVVEICPPKDDINVVISRSRRVRPALAYIHDHFARPIRRDELARLVNMSRTPFHRLFRQVTGMGPMEYLKHRRLSVAQRLLLTTDTSVKEISSTVGYQDPFHFTRLFTAAVGCSPREFRSRAGIKLKRTPTGTIH